jgi:hypothetical protein
MNRQSGRCYRPSRFGAVDNSKVAFNTRIMFDFIDIASAFAKAWKKRTLGRESLPVT